MLPGVQRERSAGHNVSFASPGVAELFDGLLIDYPKELMRHKAKKKRRRLSQRDAQSVIIDSFDADVFGFDRHELFACYGAF